MAYFESTFDAQTKVVVVHVRGEIDLLSSFKLDQQLRHARLRSPNPIVVNLEAVTYVDTSVIEVLKEHARIEPFTIIASPKVRRVLGQVPLGDRITMI
jgi:anti-anti-sigma factor